MPATDAKRRRIGEGLSTSQRALAPAPPARPAAPANGLSSSSNTKGLSVPVLVRPLSYFQSVAANNLAPPAPAPAPPPPPAAIPRLRTIGFNKPTTPAVPSPLRQAWSQSDSSPPTLKPTHAASVLTELLKEVTPPKLPPFANPYEALYPGSLKDAIMRYAPSRKRKNREDAKANATKAAETAREQKVEEKKEKAPEMTTRRIIEATVPKVGTFLSTADTSLMSIQGAKRARPPPELMSRNFEPPQPEAGSSRSAQFKTPEPPSAPTTSSFSSFIAASKEVRRRPLPTVEEVSDEEQPSPPKKPKIRSPAAHVAATPPPAPISVPTRPPVPTRTILVEEIDDQDMETDTTPVVHPSQVIEPTEDRSRRSSSPTSPVTTVGSNPFPSAKSSFPVKSSAPKAPSKLRYSIQPEGDETEEMNTQDKTAVSVPMTIVEDEPMEEGPKSVTEVKGLVKTLSKNELPSFAFNFPNATPGAGPSTLMARETAKATTAFGLPTFPFSAGEQSSSAPVAFDWNAAGMKKPAPEGDSWTCSTCMLQNPATVKDKCTVCDAPRPGAASTSAAPPAFDWSAAGMKKPSSGGNQWTCGTCMLANPATATDKCTVCDAPRPGAASTSAAPPAFNWSAAGMKKPSSGGDQWTCGTCMLANPATATEKCTVCDAPRPGAASAAPASKEFNWSAAGMKKPSSGGDQWTCGTCMLANPATATDKCTVCDAPRPGAKSAAPAPQGFNWAAAGMKQPSNAGWTCKTCMLQNPANATKCTVCDESR